MKHLKYIFVIAILLGCNLLIMSCNGKAGFYDDSDLPDIIDDTSDTNDTTDTSDTNDNVDSDTDTDNSPVCGNGSIEEGEVCDDGNNISADGCNASCSLLDALDFIANTKIVGDQTDPILITGQSNDSTFVLLYTDWGENDGNKAGVFAEFFASDGRHLADAGLSEIIGHNQQKPAGVISSNKLFAVWENNFEGSNSKQGIRASIFSLNGIREVSEFQVDTTFNGEDLSPQIACDDLDRCLVVWVDTSGIDGADLKGRFFDLNGNALNNAITGDASEFLVDATNVSGLQLNPKVYYLSNHWLVVFEDYSSSFDSEPPGIKAVLLTLSGEVENIYSFNSISSSKQVYPVFASIPSGYVACWTDNSHNFDPWVWGINCRIFDTNFNPIGDDFGVNEIVKSSQINQGIVVLDDSFVVYWEDWSASDGNGAGIKARKISFDGTQLYDEIQINTTYMGHQKLPTAIKIGNLLWFAWSDGSEEGDDNWGYSIRLKDFKVTGFAE